MSKPIEKVNDEILDDMLGVDLLPDMPSIPAPAPMPQMRQDVDKLPDNKAVQVAKERIEQMKRRRGRSSLRQDLALAPNTGAGIAIPR